MDQTPLWNQFEGYGRYFFLGGNAGWANIRGVLQNNIDDLVLREEGQRGKQSGLAPVST